MDTMDQPTFADLEYDGKKRKTRREIFLERMDGLIPWEELEERIRPYYPKAGRGRRPYELSAMLRIHCVQLFYNLSDPGMEDMLYEVESVRRFVGLRLSGPLPDETTILNFRHLLEEHGLGERLFADINGHLASQGLRLREGTIVDASIIEAPSSTKNRVGERDPEMHQTKKGSEWHFGMKVHVGVDSETGVVHSMSTTPANVHDVREAHRLLHGGEKQVWGDAGYQGVDKRGENRELEVEWHVAMRPGQRRKLEPGSEVALSHGPIPARLFELGLRWFQDDPDTERLFAVRWDGRAYRLVVPPQVGTATSLAYRPPAGVVAEFHSHGSSRAFFSATDDRDEQGFRIYGVAGRLDAPLPELSLRVGVYGHFAPVGWPQVFDGPDPGVRLMGAEPGETQNTD